MNIGDVNDIFPRLIIGKNFLMKNHKVSVLKNVCIFQKSFFKSKNPKKNQDFYI